MLYFHIIYGKHKIQVLLLTCVMIVFTVSAQNIPSSDLIWSHTNMTVQERDKTEKLQSDLNKYKNVQDSVLNVFYEKQGKTNKNMEGIYHLKMGIFMQTNRRYEEAVESHLKALSIFEVTDNLWYKSLTYNEMASCMYRYGGDAEEMLGYYQKALAGFKESGDFERVALAYANIGNIYKDYKKDINKCLEYYDECLKYKKYIKKGPKKDYLMLNTVSNYSEGKQYVKALAIIDTILADNFEEKEVLIKGSVFLNLGWINKINGQDKEALKHYDKALKIYLSDAKIDYPTIIHLTKNIVESAYNLGDKDKMIEGYQLRISAMDSLNAQSNRAIAEQALKKYEVEKKESENKILKSDLALQKSYQNMLFLGIIGLLAFGSVIGFGYKKIKAKNTQLANQKEELERQKKMKNEFFENITHEFRTPLTLISCITDTIVEKHAAYEELEQDGNRIKQNVKRLSTMVDDILNLSQQGKADFNLLRTRVSLKDFFNKTISTYQHLLSSKNLKLTLDMKMSDVVLMLDERKMDMIWSNLINNATKYCDDNTTINIKVHYGAEEIYLSIHNHGKAIGEELLKDISNRYVRGENKSKVSGNGIGLAVVKELVEIQEGRLIINSNEQSGTTVTIGFPLNLLVEQTYFQPEHTHLQQAIINDVAPTILLVDDNPDILYYMQEMLTSEGYKVFTAKSGSEAELILNETKPNILITDYLMPDMNGLELARKIRLSDQEKNLPIIFITASTNHDVKMEILEMGVDDYINKPFDKNELLARIRYIIKRTSSIKEEEVKEDENKEILSHQNELVRDFRKFIEENLDNLQINIPDIASALSMTERSLFRKIKANTGLTPNEYIKEIRLQQAKRLLESQKFPTLKQVSYAVGFSSTSYFTSIYKERFGKHPAEYL